jgi:hypothetical protein
MMLARAWLPAVTGFFAFAAGAFGQGRPNYSGTWELTRIERSDGMKIPAGRTFKETQIWVHQEPKLNIKIMTWEDKLGYRTVDVTYDTNGKAGLVGYLMRPDGGKEPVNGSARWNGNRLVHEQETPNNEKGATRRMISTAALTDNGQRLLVQQVYWLVGESEKREAQWFYEKKSGTP